MRSSDRLALWLAASALAADVASNWWFHLNPRTFGTLDVLRWLAELTL